MKFILTGIVILAFLNGFAQDNQKISTVEFVQVVNNNREEAVYYYENNWKILREMAVERRYIDSFQILETTFSEATPFHFILITTYADKSQFDLREPHFRELIKEKGALTLLNEIQPNDFRKNVDSKENVRHLN